MADNINITAGVGTPVATDEASDGKHYQKIKAFVGTADSIVPIGHAEDSAHASGDGGIMALAVRQDAAAALSGTDGDYSPLSVDDTGHLRVVARTTTGQLTQFNRIGAGSIVQYVAVSASGVVVSGPCIFYGYKVITAGSSIIVYDSTTTAGSPQVIIPSASTTSAGSTNGSTASHACGLLMNNGVYTALTGGGTFIFYYVPVA